MGTGFPAPSSAALLAAAEDPLAALRELAPHAPARKALADLLGEFAASQQPPHPKAAAAAVTVGSAVLEDVGVMLPLQARMIQWQAQSHKLMQQQHTEHLQWLREHAVNECPEGHHHHEFHNQTLNTIVASGDNDGGFAGVRVALATLREALGDLDALLASGSIDREGHLFLSTQLSWAFHAVVRAEGVLGLAAAMGGGAALELPVFLLAIYQAAMDGVPVQAVHAHAEGLFRPLAAAADEHRARLALVSKRDPAAFCVLPPPPPSTAESPGE